MRIAVKGLVNFYREMNPELLAKKLRGREATAALASGEFETGGTGSEVSLCFVEFEKSALRVLSCCAEADLRLMMLSRAQ